MGKMKYVVNYMFLRRKTHGRYHFWIYPKMYASIINEDQYKKLKNEEALACLTKVKEKQKPMKQIAFIVNIRPASKADLEKFKDLDLVGPIKPDEDQKATLKHFKKVKFGIDE